MGSGDCDGKDASGGVAPTVAQEEEEEEPCVYRKSRPHCHRRLGFVSAGSRPVMGFPIGHNSIGFSAVNGLPRALLH